MTGSTKSLTVALVAGEASGDKLGAGLIDAIRRRRPDSRFEGVAGPAMRRAGCEVLHDTDELAVMGLVEILGHLPRLLSLRRSLVRHWTEHPPDLLVGIDAPDFNLGLERKLRGRAGPVVHYVSPTVWAWRARRMKKIRKACDRVLCLFPFEKGFYDRHGMDAVFVGHPRAETIPRQPDRLGARAELGVDAGSQVLGLLPGSRRSEVVRLAPEFLRTAAWLAARRPTLRFVGAMASASAREAFEAARQEVAPELAVTMADDGVDTTLAACDVALVASGTATLETALYGRPMVVAYRMASSTYRIVRALNLIRLEHFSLPNLLAREPLVPEFLQDEVVAEHMGPAVLAWFDDHTRRTAAEREFARIREDLARGADERAAEAVLDLLPAVVS